MAAVLLNPAAGDHPTDRETEQIHRLLARIGGFDLVAELAGRFSNRGHPQPQAQCRQQPLLALIPEQSEQRFKHRRGIQEAMDEYQRRGVDRTSLQ
jgi:hypothetical protein